MRRDAARFPATYPAFLAALLLGIAVGRLLKQRRQAVNRVDARLALAKAESIAARLKAEESRVYDRQTP